MITQAFASRTFTAADQEQFARLSGDVNPMHMDPVAARRTQAGAPVVHGVHALLWAFESLVEARKLQRPPVSILADFKKFIYVDAQVAAHIVHQDDGNLEVALLSDGIESTIIRIDFLSPDEAQGLVPEAPMVPVGSYPLVHDIQDLAGISGLLRATQYGRDRMDTAFPLLEKILGKDRLLSIALTSTLVGMVCPGLHSIFGTLTINLVADSGISDGLGFVTTDVDERFRMIEMRVAGSRIAGMVTAFARVPPVIQPALAEIAQKVDAQEFRNCSALIVGGSRGLGAMVAKTITAGGGRVIVTYASGRSDAEALRDEINAVRPQACRTMQYHLRSGNDNEIGDIGSPVNQLYFFATPQIYRQSPDFYAPHRLSGFLHFYADAFYALTGSLLRANAAGLKVFYPSSVFVDEAPKGMIEYGMAKAAGELLCQAMNRYMPNVKILAPRLPRMLTDQSATVVPVEMEDTLTVMLPFIRQMAADQAAPS